MRSLRHDRVDLMRLRGRIGPLRRRCVARGYAISGASRRARGRLDGSSAAVLMYHRVLPRPEAERSSVEPGMYVSPETFDRHLAWLNEYFRVLPLHEIVARLRDRRSLPNGACAITFDDGWRDNRENALPVLEARGVPATIFVVTGRVGTQGGYWPDEVARRLASLGPQERRSLTNELGLVDAGDSVPAALMHLKRLSEAERPALIERIRRACADPGEEVRELLDWDELMDLSRRGVDIESHGLSHAILTGLAKDDVDRELRTSLLSLREHGHGRHALFAYPSGGFDPAILRLAADAGYLGAVTTQRGLASSRCGSLALPRIGLHEDISSTRAEFLRWIPGSARPLEGTAS